VARRRRLAVLTTMSVWPPRRGGQNRVAGLLSNLGEGWEVCHFAQSIQRTDLPVPRRRVTVTPAWTEWRLMDPVSWAWMFLAGRLGYPPVGADALLRLAPRRAVRRAIQAADAVLVFHPWQVAWARRLTPRNVPLVLDASDVATVLYAAGASPLRQRVHRRLTRDEDRAWHLADVVVLASEADRAVVAQAGISETAVLPNGVDTRGITPASAETRAAALARLGVAPGGCVALFIGSRHPPNLEAVAALEAQAPAFAAAGITLVLVGRSSLGRDARPGIIHAGEVPDVRPYLDAADLGLCPLAHGTGTSDKVLTYLAAGLPTLATPVGARGFEGEDAGIEVCAAEAMPARAAALFADPAAMTRMGASARRVAADTYDWRQLGARLGGILDRAISTCSPRL